MKALFLESRAAAQITMYADEIDLDADGLAEMLENAYKYGRKYPNNFRWVDGINYNDWWVTMCLKDDSHKSMDVNCLMAWASTPEGHAFWKNINRYKPEGGEEED
jgi:hypothetical protein